MWKCVWIVVQNNKVHYLDFISFFFCKKLANWSLKLLCLSVIWITFAPNCISLNFSYFCISDTMSILLSLLWFWFVLKEVLSPYKADLELSTLLGWIPEINLYKWVTFESVLTGHLVLLNFWYDFAFHVHILFWFYFQFLLFSFQLIFLLLFCTSEWQECC